MSKGDLYTKENWAFLGASVTLSIV